MKISLMNRMILCSFVLFHVLRGEGLYLLMSTQIQKDT